MFSSYCLSQSTSCTFKVVQEDFCTKKFKNGGSGWKCSAVLCASFFPSIFLTSAWIQLHKDVIALTVYSWDSPSKVGESPDQSKAKLALVNPMAFLSLCWLWLVLLHSYIFTWTLWHGKGLLYHRQNLPRPRQLAAFYFKGRFSPLSHRRPHLQKKLNHNIN